MSGNSDELPDFEDFDGPDVPETFKMDSTQFYQIDAMVEDAYEKVGVTLFAADDDDGLGTEELSSLQRERLEKAKSKLDDIRSVIDDAEMMNRVE